MYLFTREGKGDTLGGIDSYFVFVLNVCARRTMENEIFLFKSVGDKFPTLIRLSQNSTFVTTCSS